MAGLHAITRTLYPGQRVEHQSAPAGRYGSPVHATRGDREAGVAIAFQCHASLMLDAATLAGVEVGALQHVVHGLGVHAE